MKKYSKQRELIIENLKQRTDHPTAEKLYLDLKERIPEMGIATVYRNLTELCEKGIVIKVKSKTGVIRYDGNQEPHIHFECNRCGEIMDIYLEETQQEIIGKIIQGATEEDGEKFESSQIYIEGLCKKCKTR